MSIKVKEYDTEKYIHIMKNHIVYFHSVTKGMRALTLIMLSNGNDIYVYQTVEEVQKLIS